MSRTREFPFIVESLAKGAREYACSYKTVEEAKQAILRELE